MAVVAVGKWSNGGGGGSPAWLDHNQQSLPRRVLRAVRTWNRSACAAHPTTPAAPAPPPPHPGNQWPKGWPGFADGNLSLRGRIRSLEADLQDFNAAPHSSFVEEAQVLFRANPTCINGPSALYVSSSCALEAERQEMADEGEYAAMRSLCVSDDDGLQFDDYPPYWPPGTPPVRPSWRRKCPPKPPPRTYFPKGKGSCVKQVEVVLRRDVEGNLGFNLRHAPKDKSSLVVTSIKPGGPAFCSGCMRVGDRLVGINGASLVGVSLQRAHDSLLRKATLALTRLLLEVEVAPPPPARPTHLLLEVRKVGGDPSLGLSLAGDNDAVLVSAIQPASAVHRSGLVEIGDQILSVDGCPVSSCSEALRLLNGGGEGVQLKVGTKPPSSTLRSRKLSKSESSSVSGHTLSRRDTPTTVSHCESVAVTLHAAPGGYGITLDGSWPPVIADIEPGSPADLCGCLGAGDRIVIINQTRCDCLSGAEAARLLAASAPLLKLHVQFDVADAVVPASGVFVLKVARRGVADLGIFVTSMKMPANAPIISRIRRGSVAHRCGALQCGDQLLEMTTPHHPQHPDHHVVALKVLKAASYATCRKADSMERNVHTVEVVRSPPSRPLGVTISGTEMRGMPITISALTAGGLAEATGALMVGDQLLAINGHSLLSFKLSEAVDLLQAAKDTIVLQVASSELPSPGGAWPMGRMRTFGSTESDLSTICTTDEWEAPEFKPKLTASPTPASSIASCLSDVHKVVLAKDGVYEDFGFSVSDGLYERGVYINRVRAGGPADKAGLLQPYDRILQVNGTRTEDFDCCLTVPLIATAGDKMELVVARNPFGAVAHHLSKSHSSSKDDCWNQADTPLSNSM